MMSDEMCTPESEYLEYPPYYNITAHKSTTSFQVEQSESKTYIVLSRVLDDNHPMFFNRFCLYL